MIHSIHSYPGYLTTLFKLYMLLCTEWCSEFDQMEEI